jgi:hypothetical protein
MDLAHGRAAGRWPSGAIALAAKEQVDPINKSILLNGHNIAALQHSGD